MSDVTPVLLDTHIWVKYQNGSDDIRAESKPVIEAAASRGLVFVSVISVWEIALLARLGRLSFSHTVTHWVSEALSKPGIQLLPFTPEIAIASVDLPEPIHKDPSDRILVASARVERLTLVTRDRDILTFAKSIKLACLQA